jgi:glycosyltransferase involved in cell wall biosynthesis
MQKISAILNTYNEGDLLEDCLLSIEGFVDEIILSDMGSRDNSRKIGLSHGCKIVTVKPAPVVEETILQKIDIARNDWIFSLDPDMRVPNETWGRINEVLMNEDCDAISFHMKNRVFGRWVEHGHGSQCNFFRLFKKSSLYRNGAPAEYIHGLVYQAVKGGRVHYLPRKYPIVHLAYDDVAKALEQHLRYAKYEAKQLQAAGVSTHLLLGILKAFRKLGGDMIARQAWRSGKEGVVFSFVAFIMLLQKELMLFQYNKADA